MAQLHYPLMKYECTRHTPIYFSCGDDCLNTSRPLHATKGVLSRFVSNKRLNAPFSLTLLRSSTGLSVPLTSPTHQILNLLYDCQKDRLFAINRRSDVLLPLIMASKSCFETANILILSRCRGLAQGLRLSHRLHRTPP